MKSIEYFQNFDEINKFFDGLFLYKLRSYRNCFRELLHRDEYKVDHENPTQLFSFD